VTSGVAPLRRVLVHRPGRELARVSPANMHELLFDDVPWPEGARAEHDAFCARLRERGVEVCDAGELLADVLRGAGASGCTRSASTPSTRCSRARRRAA
jgi:arginine deiminase